jgi:serine/threonine protein kinase
MKKYYKYMRKMEKYNRFLMGGFKCDKIPKVLATQIEKKFEFSYDVYADNFQKLTQNYYILVDYEKNGIEKIILGTGGGGIVYKGIMKLQNDDDDDIIIPVAIKIITLNDKTINNICSELTAICNLDNNNILKYYGYCDIEEMTKNKENKFCIITEFIAGKELLHEMDTLTLEQKYNITDQLINGLKYLHSNNVYHRDIKVQNIMIDRSNEENIKAKYIDLGLSCVQNLTCQFINFRQGTLIFLSPDFFNKSEQIIKENLDKMDMWALGCVLYMLFTNNILHDFYSNREITQEQKMLLIKNTTQEQVDKEITENMRDLPESIINIVRNLLLVDYKLRNIANFV